MEKTSKPIVAGIFNVVVGIFGLITAAGLFIGFGVIGSVMGGAIGGALGIPGMGLIPDFVPGLLLGMAIPTLIISIFVLIGGIFTLQRKRWGWALAGSIIAILSFFPLVCLKDRAEFYGDMLLFHAWPLILF